MYSSLTCVYRRYFQSQGYIPRFNSHEKLLNHIIRVVRGSNQDHFCNCTHQCGSQLVSWWVSITNPCALINYRTTVWGPEPVRLGFIGAPLASAISFNLIAIASVLYGAFFVPKTAWHPISGRMFTKLGTLLHLGLAGVVQVGSEWWSWELINCEQKYNPNFPYLTKWLHSKLQPVCEL